jgi:glycosyltransferase involved in cell wall biosynthesis
MVLDSLLKQNLTISSFEVLLVDNNSTDETGNIVNSYQKENLNFPLKYILETNQGISYARNRGVKEAKGEIIVFIDDDETVDEDYLSHLKCFFENNPKARICTGPVIPVYEQESPKWLSKYTLRAVTGAYDKGRNQKRIYEKDCPGTGHASFRKGTDGSGEEFNPDLGRKGTSLLGAEDKDFFLRILEAGGEMYYLPEAKIYHHIPASKLTDDYFKRVSTGIGKSERIRTLNIGKKAYRNRLIEESEKWAATLILWFGYAASGQINKANKLVEFRTRITKGLLKKD